MGQRPACEQSMHNVCVVCARRVCGVCAACGVGARREHAGGTREEERERVGMRHGGERGTGKRD